MSTSFIGFNAGFVGGECSDYVLVASEAFSSRTLFEVYMDKEEECQKDLVEEHVKSRVSHRSGTSG